QAQKPSNKNQYTGLFEGKNLILISAEAFSAEVIDPELTPTLYRMATKGINFNDYYQPAWGGSTSTGEYSNVFGIVPVNGVSSIQDTIGRDNYTTIGSKLRKLGYWSCAYHNGFATYYDRDKTHKGLGYDDYIAKGTGLSGSLDGVWPESDLKMMEGTVGNYINNQPFSVYYMTVSGHCNYAWTANAMSKKNRDAVASLNYKEQTKGYLAANLELEYAMDYLIKRLEEAGIADNTVIVMGTDHYPYGLEKSSAWGTTEDYLSDLYGYSYKNVKERDHSRLIIWSGCLEKMDPIVVSEPTYSLDILPTLCNLFAIDYDSRLLVGRDVFSTKDALVLWTNGTWLTTKGFYDSGSGKFTAAEGAGEVSSDYINDIKSIVRGKIQFSRYVLNDDYYKYFK
ncbi:MAG: LTA synthase family protein, partial [Clostridia bacterium]|nr:LTA synthase family protein [Clostridia bacterium]